MGLVVAPFCGAIVLFTLYLELMCKEQTRKERHALRKDQVEGEAVSIRRGIRNCCVFMWCKQGGPSDLQREMPDGIVLEYEIAPPLEDEAAKEQ